MFQTKQESNVIDKLIDSFKRQCVNSRFRQFSTETPVMEGWSVYNKYCIESYKSISKKLDEVKGLVINFKATPVMTYITYSGIMDRSNNSMFIPSYENIIRSGIMDHTSEVVIPDQDIGKVINEMDEYASCIIKQPEMDKMMGRAINGSFGYSVVIGGMRIVVSYNSIIKGFSSLDGKGDVSLLDIHQAISRDIVEGRDKCKDLNWFMYKIVSLNKLINNAAGR